MCHWFLISGKWVKHQKVHSLCCQCLPQWPHSLLGDVHKSFQSHRIISVCLGVMHKEKRRKDDNAKVMSERMIPGCQLTKWSKGKLQTWWAGLDPRQAKVKNGRVGIWKVDTTKYGKEGAAASTWTRRLLIRTGPKFSTSIYWLNFGLISI